MPFNIPRRKHLSYLSKRLEHDKVKELDELREETRQVTEAAASLLHKTLYQQIQLSIFIVAQ